MPTPAAKTDLPASLDETVGDDEDLPLTVVGPRCVSGGGLRCVFCGGLRSGWQALELGELWRYRELLFFLAWRDVKVRYKQTLLGAAWAILQPTLMMVVFTLVVGRLDLPATRDVKY